MAITVSIKLDTSDADRAGKDIARKIDNALDAGVRSAREAGRRIGDALSAGFDEGVRRAHQARQQLDRALSPDRRHAANEAAERQHQQKLEVIHQQSASRLSQIEARRQAQIDQIRERGVQKELARQRQLESAGGGRLQAFGGGAVQAGTALAAGVTLPFLAIGSEILRVGKEFEQAQNLFQAATRATSEEMKRAGEEAKRLGADLTLPATSAADAAKAMTELAKGGLSARDAIDAARGTLQLAAAAAIEEAQAAEIAANALNAFGLKAKEAGRVADLLAAAANASSAEITDVAFSLQQSSAAAAALKVPIEDLVTAISLMANSGIKGSDAGTSLKTAFLALAAPSKKAAEEMKALGINVFDTLGRMRPLREVIDQFSTAFAKLSDEQRLQAAKTIFGSDAMRAALIVFGGGVETFDKLKDSVTRQGAAAELAAARTKGLSGAFAGLKSQLETGALVVFEKIKDPLERLVRGLADFAGKAIDVASKFAEANPEIANAALIFTTVAAAIGPVLLGLGALATLIGTIGAPVLAAIAVITAGAAALSAAWASNFLGIRDVTSRVFGEVSKFVGEQWAVIVAFFKENGPIIREAVANVLNAIRAFWKENGETITTIVRSTWDIIKTVFGTGLRNILDVIKLIAQAINGDWAGAWKTFNTIVDRSVDAVLKILFSLGERGFAVMKLAFKTLLAVDKAILDGLLSLGKAIIDGVIKGIKNAASSFAGAIRDVIQDGIKAAKLALGISSPSRVFEQIGLNISEGFARGIASLDSVLDNAIGRLTSKLGAFSQIASTVLSGIARGVLGGLGIGVAGAGGGALGNIFRTAPTFPSERLPAPPSISALSQFFGASVPGTAGAVGGGGIDSFFGPSVPRVAGVVQPTFGSFVSGIGRSVASAAPSLGLSLGSALGGQSTLGKILGGAGGALVGVGLTAAPASAGFLAPLFSNPITAIVGGALLIGGFFLGRAKQRRKDEEAAGQFLGQAFQAVEQLAAGIAADQIEGAQARAILESQIVNPFIQQINSLKTASVRRDWVKNQVPEIRARFEANIVPLIADQARRRLEAEAAAKAAEAAELARQEELRKQALIHSRLIPQFARGGVVRGLDTGRDSVFSFLRPGEMVLTVQHQATIKSIAGADVFSKIGVPGAQPQATFQNGGVVPLGFGRAEQPLVVNLDVQVGMSKSGAEEIFVIGGSSEGGRRVIINQVRTTQLNRG